MTTQSAMNVAVFVSTRTTHEQSSTICECTKQRSATPRTVCELTACKQTRRPTVILTCNTFIQKKLHHPIRAGSSVSPPKKNKTNQRHKNHWATKLQMRNTPCSSIGRPPGLRARHCNDATIQKPLHTLSVGVACAYACAQQRDLQSTT